MEIIGISPIPILHVNSMANTNFGIDSLTRGTGPFSHTNPIMLLFGSFKKPVGVGSTKKEKHTKLRIRAQSIK